MKERRTGFICHCIKIIAVLAFSAVLRSAPCALAETVVCDETTLSVNAADMKAEELLKAIGEACGIKVVLRGDVFTEDTYSVQFENMPVRTGIERILRVVNLPNHMMHFEESNGRKRIREIDLVGKKGGERQLTSGEQSGEPERPNRPSRKNEPQAEKPALRQQQEEDQQEKAIEVMDEILDAQAKDENKPEPPEVPEMFRQPLAEGIHGELPASLPQGLEQDPEK